MRVLVFGDSITQGFWDTEGGWVARLRKHYDKLQIQDLKNRDEPTVFNLGISGGNSKTILALFNNEVAARKNSENLAIMISTGVNDSCIEKQGRLHSTSPNDYLANLQELAEKAKKYSSRVIFVGLVACDEKQTTPVFWRDIHYTNKHIAGYEEVMAKVAEEQKISFIPVHAEFKKHLDAGEKLLADGLHPNNDGHELVFELVRPAVDKILNT
ncbi:MAG TPA: GDSL-type esterase/lipase family protein [Candidatus Babeliales bacterium]|nr:GDSL-type esterase/lipase family protein [Candidatus Babeliales bacterium]